MNLKYNFSQHNATQLYSNERISKEAINIQVAENTFFVISFTCIYACRVEFWLRQILVGITNIYNHIVHIRKSSWNFIKKNSAECWLVYWEPCPTISL